MNDDEPFHPSWDYVELRRCIPIRNAGVSYPARTPGEARAQLRNLEHDQIHRLIPNNFFYVLERRRLIRLALGTTEI